MKKMKMWKKGLIVIAIILLVFIIIFVRKIVILTSLDNKISKYENNQNYYGTITCNKESYPYESVKIYLKDNVKKSEIMYKTKNNLEKELIQFEYPNELKQFKRTGDIKEYTLQSNQGDLNNTIVNFTDTVTLSEKILDSIFTTIKKVEVNGKKCYELGGFNHNFVYGDSTKKIIVYIEIDTGLPVKMVEIVDDNGNEKIYETKYEHKFNTVTDEDIQEPDSSQYQVK